MRTFACAVLLWISLARFSVPVGAQDLQTLTVTRFTLSLAPNEPSTVDLTSLVHVIIRIHVREKIERLNNVLLPDLSGFQTEGDEHTLTSGTGGSDYKETVTLSPQRIGEFTLGPATVDSVNHLNGVPSRWSSNSLPLTVTLMKTPDDWLANIRAGILIVLVVIFVIVAFFVGRAMLDVFARRLPARKAVPPTDTPLPFAAAPLPSPPGRLVRLTQALETARRDPSRTSALELRLALRDALHAHPDETLSDILVRVPDGERGIFARALRAAERAAFIDDEARTTALEDGLVLIDAARTRLERDA